MKNSYLLAMLALIAFVITISSCKKNDDPQIDETVLKIDSIIHLDTIGLGGTLNIQFYGVLGDGCDYFSRIAEEELDDNDIKNTFKIKILKKRLDNGACSEEIKYLEDAYINLTGMLSGDFVIKVVQPDGSFLIGNVFVK
jgi:hypothetical protein